MGILGGGAVRLRLRGVLEARVVVVSLRGATGRGPSPGLCPPFSPPVPASEEHTATLLTLLGYSRHSKKHLLPSASNGSRGGK